jgi:hypothetical protein
MWLSRASGDGRGFRGMRNRRHDGIRHSSIETPSSL